MNRIARGALVIILLLGLSTARAEMPLPEAPDGFEITMFAEPPRVNYPVCLAATPTGELYIGVDPQGSLGKKKGEGKILRCLDTDGDGRADQITEFAQVDHPRGLVVDGKFVWVLHPPHLTVYRDDDGDGVADGSLRLVENISTIFNEKRGADHTTNGIRLGIDGWIYIAVGDFGFAGAKGTDGRELTLLGGGVVRVRPDGSEIELYARGLRNIVDVCVDPYLNLFTRDNTNDGGGWNLRFSHVVQTARYGYPSLFTNFTDEIVPALADYGGGSGCGGMYLHELGRFPAPFDDAAMTCDWGRNAVFAHTPKPLGTTFSDEVHTFFKVPRPTDIVVDGSARLYVSSWRGGQFKYKGPDVGYVAQLRPAGASTKSFPDLQRAKIAELVTMHASPSGKMRLAAQRELLRRDPNVDDAAARLAALAGDSSKPLYGRVAAIFTLKQLAAAAAHPALIKLAADATVREFALRALTDRTTQLEGVPVELFVKALGDEHPRVRAAAIIGLGRLGDAGAAKALLPLAAYRPPAPVSDHQPSAELLEAHLAVQALVALGAVEPCLEAIGGPHHHGALWALRYLHDAGAVDGLIARLRDADSPAIQRDLIAALIRLYHREHDYEGTTWWGTRPDRTGPYFKRVTWSESEKIADALRAALGKADAQTHAFAHEQLKRHRVAIKDLPGPGEPVAAGEPTPVDEPTLKLPTNIGDDPKLIANRKLDDVKTVALKTRGDAKRGEKLFTTQGCVVCHTTADGQTPRGPHLASIGQRYSRAELIESILEPAAVIAQGFDTYVFNLKGGASHLGFVTSESAEEIALRNATGQATVLQTDQITGRTKLPMSMMPPGLANNLTPEQLADLLAYLESLN